MVLTCVQWILLSPYLGLKLESAAKHITSSPSSQFDPDCFSFVLQFFRSASDAFYGTDATPGLYLAQQHLIDTSSDFANQNPLISKQAIIVLREELEYFSIPPKGGKASTDVNGIANEGMLELKRDCGKYLLEKRSIFTALQRNVNKENNIAEQHLIDMLCMRYGRVHYRLILILTHPHLVVSTARMNGASGRLSLPAVVYLPLL